MPWEIYLDWLEDQGHDELRGISQFDLCCLGESMIYDIPINYGCGVTGDGIILSEYMGMPIFYVGEHFICRTLDNWLFRGEGSYRGHGNVPEFTYIFRE